MNIDDKMKSTVADIVRRVNSVKIPIGRMKTHQRLVGDRNSVHRGEGDNFDGHDLYCAGDDPRTIDWNATALTGGQQILVALFKEEAQIKGSILCDVSPSMNFGSTRVTKRVLAAELAACAVRSLSRTHDPVGLVTYSRTGVERRVRSNSSASMLRPVILHILDSKHVDRPGKHSGLAKSLALVPRTPSILFVVSDFLNVTEADWIALRRAGRRHRIFAMVVQDLREREYPKAGLLPYLYTLRDSDGNTSEVLVTKGRAKKFAAASKARQDKVLARLKEECRAAAIVVSTEEGPSAASRVLNFLQSPVK